MTAATSPGSRPSRTEYMEKLRPLLAQLVMAVHEEGAGEVRAALRAALALTPPRGQRRVESVLTALAVLVDPDAPMGELMGWGAEVPWPDATTTAPPAGTTRAAARPRRTYIKGPVTRRETDLIEACLDGRKPSSELSPRELEVVVETLHRKGFTARMMHDRTGVSLRTVARVRIRLGLSPVLVPQQGGESGMLDLQVS